MKIVVERLKGVPLEAFLKENGLELKVRERRSSGGIDYLATYYPSLTYYWAEGTRLGCVPLHGIGDTPSRALSELISSSEGMLVKADSHEEADILVPDKLIVPSVYFV